jgi:hypothetical protein
MHVLAKHAVHDQISLIRVNNEKELLRYNMDTLSREIHDCDAPRMFPLFLVYYQGSIRGYIRLTEQIVVYPAIHPEMMEARDFIRVVRDLVTECKRMFGNPIFLLCDKAEELGAKHMAAIRLKKTDETAYSYFNPQENN